jgi:hypothetical protein
VHCSPRVGQIDTAAANVHFGGFSDEVEGDDDGVLVLAYPLASLAAAPQEKHSHGGSDCQRQGTESG